MSVNFNISNATNPPNTVFLAGIQVFLGNSNTPLPSSYTFNSRIYGNWWPTNVPFFHNSLSAQNALAVGGMRPIPTMVGLNFSGSGYNCYQTTLRLVMPGQSIDSWQPTSVFISGTLISITYGTFSGLSGGSVVDILLIGQDINIFSQDITITW